MMYFEFYLVHFLVYDKSTRMTYCCHWKLSHQHFLLHFLLQSLIRPRQ